MTRKRNKSDMTIPEQLEAIKAKMCDSYCRFPEMALETNEDPDEAWKWLEHTYCNGCPMNELKPWRDEDGRI